MDVRALLIAAGREKQLKKIAAGLSQLLKMTANSSPWMGLHKFVVGHKSLMAGSEAETKKVSKWCQRELKETVAVVLRPRHAMYQLSQSKEPTDRACVAAVLMMYLSGHRGGELESLTFSALTAHGWTQYRAKKGESGMLGGPIVLPPLARELLRQLLGHPRLPADIQRHDPRLSPKLFPLTSFCTRKAENFASALEAMQRHTKLLMADPEEEEVDGVKVEAGLHVWRRSHSDMRHKYVKMAGDGIGHTHGRNGRGSAAFFAYEPRLLASSVAAFLWGN